MAVKSNYAPVNGLNLYYEIHGTGQPLVLLHGAFSAIGTSFGKLLPALAEGRQVIAVELQAHGRTADIDRPISPELMADDIAALLRHLEIEQADLLGYSMGAAVALDVTIKHPDLVRKLAVVSASHNANGLHPGMNAGMDSLEPEHLMGSPWHDEYVQLAPDPEQFPTLVAKIKQMIQNVSDVADEDIATIKAPTLIIIADSDIVRPEHAVAMFRLLGGGVMGETDGMPNAQLAILPGAQHSTVMERTDLLLPVLTAFLDAPMPEQS